MTVDGSGVASAQVTSPPGRLIAVQAGIHDGAGGFTDATSGSLALKADTTDGVQIDSAYALSGGVPAAGPHPVGTAGVDEGNAASAATDGSSGGFPVRAGVFINLTLGTAGEVITVDLFFRLCTFAQVTLVAQSGADGTGAVTRLLRLGRAGVLAAVAIDYQNMPATTDVTIKADGSGGATLFLSQNSATDIAPSLIGRPGKDEGGASLAAADGSECGNAFRKSLYFDVAQADIFTSGNEKIIVECWIDD